MFIIRYKTIFLSLIGVLMLMSVGAVGILGLNFGIDFTGGSLLEVKYESAPARAEVQEVVEDTIYAGASIRATGSNGYIIRTRELTPTEQGVVADALYSLGNGTMTVERATTIGPTIGKELTTKSFYALSAVLLATLLYVAYAFRSVTREESSKLDTGPSSWWYGLIVLITLIHDVLIPLGVFALLGAFMGVEIDTLFVTALLVILGYSINDTIIIFDRIRENVGRVKEDKKKVAFNDLVGQSLSQTYMRSINTSLTTLLVLGAIFLFGGESTHYFTLALMIGVFAGTYSSILFAGPMLALVHDKYTK